MFLIIICFNKVAFSDSNFVVTPKPNQPNSILPVPPSNNNALDSKNTNNGKIILHYNYQMVQKIVILIKYVVLVAHKQNFDIIFGKATRSASFIWCSA